MTVFWTFLETEFQCEKKGNTIYVYLGHDISLLVNKELTLELPIQFQLSSGAVLVDTLDKRLMPLRQVYLTSEDQFMVTFYNKSYQTVNLEKGDPICILRYVS